MYQEDQNYVNQFFAETAIDNSVKATLTDSVTTLPNYPSISTTELTNGNPALGLNFEGQCQEEISTNLNIVSANIDDIPMDLTVPLDMTMKKANMNDLDNTNDDHVENIRKEILVYEDEEYGEVLQECPICFKMFMKSDYENFHLRTHKIDHLNGDSVQNVIERNSPLTKADLNDNDVLEDQQESSPSIEKSGFPESKSAKCSVDVLENDGLNMPVSKFSNNIGTNQALECESVIEKTSVLGESNILQTASDYTSVSDFTDNCSSNKILNPDTEKISDITGSTSTNQIIEVIQDKESGSLQFSRKQMFISMPDVNDHLQSSGHTDQGSDMSVTGSKSTETSELKGNVLTEQIVERLPDNEVTTLSDSYEFAESYKANQTVHNLKDNLADTTNIDIISDKLNTNQTIENVVRYETSQTVTINEFSQGSVDSFAKNENFDVSITTNKQAGNSSKDIDGNSSKDIDDKSHVIDTIADMPSKSFSDNTDNSKFHDSALWIAKDNGAAIVKDLGIPQFSMETSVNNLDHDNVEDDMLMQQSGFKCPAGQADQTKPIKFETSLDCGIFLCSKCPEMFGGDDEIKNHLQTDHPEDNEAFTVYEPNNLPPSADFIVTDDEVQEKEAPDTNDLKHTSCVQNNESFVPDKKMLTDTDTNDTKLTSSVKMKKESVVSNKRTFSKQAKLQPSKNIDSVSTVLKDSIIPTKRKRSINRKFESDFIVDVDIIDDQVKHSKKHKSGSEIKHSSDTKPNEASKSIVRHEKTVKVKTNRPFLARLAIQKKLIVIMKGIHECPICYRRVYGQLGLKNHMETHEFEREKLRGQNMMNGKQEMSARRQNASASNNELSIEQEKLISEESKLGIDSKTIANNKTENGISPKQENSVLAHMAQEVSHACPICLIQISTQKGLLMHMKTHKNEKEQASEEGGKQVVQEKLVSMVKDLHECPICSRMIAGKHPLKIHMSKHSPEIKADKKENSLKVNDDATQRQGMKMENNKAPTIIMKEKSKEANSLLIEKKEGIQSSTTKLENDSEQTKKTVIQEKLATIVGGELHECPICSRLIYGKVRLEAHLKMHSPAKMVSSEDVERDTVNFINDGIKQETKAQETQKQYSRNEILECPECSKKVLGQSRLNQHMQTHNKMESVQEKLNRIEKEREEMKRTQQQKQIVKCPKCSKQIKGQFRLEQHLQTHNKRYSGNINKQLPTKEKSTVSKISNKTGLDNKDDNKKLRTKKTEYDFSGENSSTGNIDDEEMVSKSESKSSFSTGSINFATCSICKKTVQKKHLSRHMLIHSADRPFECKICSATFARRYGLNRHFVRHSNVRDYECYKCHKTFVHKDDLNKHIKRHSGRLEFACKDCSMRFDSRGELTKHSKVHSGIRQHSCNECQKAFTHYYQLIKHQRCHRKGIVTVALKHSCTKCGKMFATRSLLESHLPVHNVPTRARAIKHSCRKCGKQFSYRYLLENHIPVHSEKSTVALPRLTKSPDHRHSESKVPTTGETLPPKLSKVAESSLTEATPPKLANKTLPELNKSTTGISTTIETGKIAVGKSVCDVCDLKFQGKSDFDRHMKTHDVQPDVTRSLSTRKSSCKICGKSFSFKASLMQHVKAHSEIREFSCSRCGKYFSTKDILDKHMAGHSNAEISCPGCKKKLMHAKSLKDHLRRCVKGKMASKAFGRHAVK